MSISSIAHIMAGIAMTGMVVMAGCGGDEPRVTRTTTTEQSTNLVPAPIPGPTTTTTTTERTTQ